MRYQYHHQKVATLCAQIPSDGADDGGVPGSCEGNRRKGLKYTFTALSNNDTSSMTGRGWEDAFGTSESAEAERR